MYHLDPHPHHSIYIAFHLKSLQAPVSIRKACNSPAKPQQSISVHINIPILQHPFSDPFSLSDTSFSFYAPLLSSKTSTLQHDLCSLLSPVLNPVSPQALHFLFRTLYSKSVLNWGGYLTWKLENWNGGGVVQIQTSGKEPLSTSLSGLCFPYQALPYALIL